MNKGFTLFEVLVTLVIISVGMTALLMVFGSALGVSGNTEEEEAALNITNAVMEDLKNTPYNSLQSYAVNSDTIFSGLAGYTIQVTTTKPSDPAEVNVSVSWTGKGGASTIALTTLAANY